MRSQFLVSFANRQLSMDAQLIELETPGLPDQKNHQKIIKKIIKNIKKPASKKASASMIFRTLC